MENNYIKVKVKSLNHDEVCSIYNRIKKTEMLPLEKLNRAEGGFKLEIAEKQNLSIDANEKCKQLRWYRGFLKPYQNYLGFDREELDTLHSALSEHLGVEDVEWHKNIRVN